MSRTIIDEGPLAINTYWGGEERGECVQFTPQGSGGTDGTGENAGYACMTREEAILLLSVALTKLIEQMRLEFEVELENIPGLIFLRGKKEARR